MKGHKIACRANKEVLRTDGARAKPVCDLNICTPQGAALRKAIGQTRVLQAVSANRSCDAGVAHACCMLNTANILLQIVRP